MTKKAQWFTKKPVRISIAAIAGIVILLSIGYLIVEKIITTPTQAVSNRNREILSEAIDKRNISLCDKISGGVLEIKPKPAPREPRNDKLITEGTPGQPARSESEYKADCRKGVESWIEIQRQLREEDAQRARH